MVEHWDFNGYFICSTGKVYSHKSGKYLSPNKTKTGYLSVMFYEAGKKPKRFYIHRLVAEAYLFRSKGKTDVNHKDGIKSNNHYSNLEWVTKSEKLGMAIVQV